MDLSVTGPEEVAVSFPKVSILWFRHGLRTHDNPALVSALKPKENGESPIFIPIFIFDGESAGTKVVGYNRMRFLMESLEDLNETFKRYYGRLRICRGDPVDVFREIHRAEGIARLCFEQDCEPIWKKRDDAVRGFCQENKIEVVEAVSHTLWNPADILEANGGTSPLTYAAFMFVTSTLGKPLRPLWVPTEALKTIKFYCKARQFETELHFPLSPQQLDIEPEGAITGENSRKGGETAALGLLDKRLAIEKAAFQNGFMQPNQSNPDLVLGISLSPALRFGNLSVRQFYWAVHDLFTSIVQGKINSSETITGQLIWREYFYVMSIHNPTFDQMRANPICLKIGWKAWTPETEGMFMRWKEGRTGFPFIDAAMRQLTQEGWLHHVTRNAVAGFLTRNDLWISWEHGLQHFLKYLLDADWSVCAGNWMWVSSSAFENALDCTHCICPTNYAQRLDPQGTFIKRYIPELKNFKPPHLFEPWKTPKALLAEWKCEIGKDYPMPIVNHETASKRNQEAMLDLKMKLLAMGDPPPHPRPSDTIEAKLSMYLPKNCSH